MIEWFNNNQGFMSAILSIVGVIISVVAIWISINVSKKQNRIALFDRKYDVYKELQDYFNGPLGWPKAISKFLMPDTNLKSDNALAPEINEIIGKASLLFSKDLNDKLHEIKNKYAEIRQIDSSISTYFSLLEEMPDFHEIKSQYVEYLQDDSPTDEAEKQFKDLCNITAISANEQIGYNEYEVVKYNFYDLNQKQSDIYQEITKLQKSVLGAIFVEIKPL
ncbi:MAG: hypothetical protein JXI43_00540 [Tissierellales bacterium]|nr:hypothetical protein [Tissierellales bacterium]